MTGTRNSIWDAIEALEGRYGENLAHPATAVGHNHEATTYQREQVPSAVNGPLLRERDVDRSVRLIANLD